MTLELVDNPQLYMLANIEYAVILFFLASVSVMRSYGICWAFGRKYQITHNLNFKIMPLWTRLFVSSIIIEQLTFFFFCAFFKLNNPNFPTEGIHYGLSITVWTGYSSWEKGLLGYIIGCILWFALNAVSVFFLAFLKCNQKVPLKDKAKLYFKIVFLTIPMFLLFQILVLMINHDYCMTHTELGLTITDP